MSAEGRRAGVEKQRGSCRTNWKQASTQNPHGKSMHLLERVLKIHSNGGQGASGSKVTDEEKHRPLLHPCLSLSSHRGPDATESCTRRAPSGPHLAALHRRGADQAASLSSPSCPVAEPGCQPRSTCYQSLPSFF